MESEKSRWVVAWFYEGVGGGKGHIQESRKGKKTLRSGYMSIIFIVVTVSQEYSHVKTSQIVHLLGNLLLVNSASVKLFLKSFCKSEGISGTPFESYLMKW